MNTQFLREANITRIVNTAKGLEIFGPKYLVSLYKVRTVLQKQ